MGQWWWTWLLRLEETLRPQYLESCRYTRSEHTLFTHTIPRSHRSSLPIQCNITKLKYSLGSDSHRLHGPAQPFADAIQHSVLQQHHEVDAGHQPRHGELLPQCQGSIWLRDHGPRCQRICRHAGKSSPVASSLSNMHLLYARMNTYMWKVTQNALQVPFTVTRCHPEDIFPSHSLYLEHLYSCQWSNVPLINIKPHYPCLLSGKMALT